MSSTTTRSRNAELAVLLAEQAQALALLCLDRKQDSMNAYLDGHQDWLHDVALGNYTGTLERLSMEARRLSDRYAELAKQDLA